MSEVTPLCCRERDSKEAFTLLELLIVILLLSLMAMLVFGSISRKKPGLEKPRISQLKQLVEKVPPEGTELLCIDECRQCFLRSADDEVHAVPFKFKAISVYILDPYDEARRVDFGRYRDQKICLRFRYRPNGSTSRMIIGSEGRFYYVPSYFGEIRKFSTLEEARAYWLRNSDLLGSRGDYY